MGGNTVHRYYAIEETTDEAWQAALNWMGEATKHIFATYPPHAIKNVNFSIVEVEEKDDGILEMFRSMDF